jgi:hypothetical protein
MVKSAKALINKLGDVEIVDGALKSAFATSKLAEP